MRVKKPMKWQCLTHNKKMSKSKTTKVMVRPNNETANLTPKLERRPFYTVIVTRTAKRIKATTV